MRKAVFMLVHGGKLLAKLARNRLLEPVSALTHLAGAVAALIGLLILVALSYSDIPKMISLVVYGASMVVLFTASTLFHGIILPEPRRMWLNRLDHAAIFLLIAGTYTPIVYNMLPAAYRWSILAAIWAMALFGILMKLFRKRIHGFINATVYPAMAWAGVVPLILIHRFEPVIPAGGLLLLLFGGFIFMGGFVVYYWRRPDPWPEVFGHHEIWHVLVLAGCLCHYIFMLLYVVPAA